MAELRIIECEDCGAPRVTRRANTKYCRVCRILKNIEFVGTRTSTCIVCKEPFAPLQRNDDVCGGCRINPVTGDPRGTCAFCSRDDASLIDSNIAVCVACATTPSLRSKFKGSMIRKIKGYRDGSIPFPEVSLPERQGSEPTDTPEV